MEQITIDQLPFKFGLLKSMAMDGLTIEKLEGESATYFYLTSSKIHRVYSYKNETAVLLSEVYLPDLMHALNNESFKNKVLSYLGN